MSRRHVRVLTALVAAMILHAVLLIWPLPADKPVDISNTLLHVDLLEAPGPAAAPSTPRMSPVRDLHEQVSAQQNSSEQPQHRSHSPATAMAPVAQRHKPAPAPLHMTTLAAKSFATSPAIRQSAPHQQRSRKLPRSLHAAVTGKKEPQPVRQAGAIPPHPIPSHQPATMTAAARSMLLANIHYPPMARRHGWQGVGEFQLDINRQSIRHVTMLASTGHAILDRAARLGLASVDHVPVADGQYRLPVEFRLQ